MTWDDFLNLKTIFLSIIVEAFPFILIGVILSSVMQNYISERWIRRILPRNFFLAFFPAALLGILFPICECAIIPVVRGFVKRGLPLHLGTVMLIASPIVNPIVFTSTYFAFGFSLPMAILRVSMGFGLALFISFVIYVIFRNSNQLRPSAEDGHEHPVHGPASRKQKAIDTMAHISDEFLSTGKYIILGAIVTSLIQTFVNREVFVDLNDNRWLSPLSAMSFSYILSLCSGSDAFIASSFKTIFATGPLIAFLLYGPILNLRNTFLMLSYFRARFVVVFMAVVTLSVYLSALIIEAWRP